MRNPSPHTEIIENISNQAHPFDLIFSMILFSSMLFWIIGSASFGLIQLIFFVECFLRYIFILASAKDFFY